MPELKPEKEKQDQLYVFISYAGADREIAEQVESFLTAAGIRVFRDRKDIRPSQSIYQSIGRALDECRQMVLLLSPNSMPDHREVFKEWLYFDGKSNPIYPLLIADCKKHYRLFEYNHIDARHDLNQALQELVDDFGKDITLPSPIATADRILVSDRDSADRGDSPNPMQALEEAIKDPKGSVILSTEQALAIKNYSPRNLCEHRLGRIAEWSLPRYRLDKRFVNLTLSLDQGDGQQQRWQKVEEFRSKDLGEVLARREEDRVLVLVGKPGSGKSTLLRRLQFDDSIDQLRRETDRISFFIQLNGYDPAQNPREWLVQCWAQSYPHLPSLETWLKEGKTLLLLDALNEMPHASVEEYNILAERWRIFAQQAAQTNNRIVFSCRTQDYGGRLSVKDAPVPQVYVQPMDESQVREFLHCYSPGREELIWEQIKDPRQLELYQTPYFLNLLCEVVDAAGEIPRGRAELFTHFVRMMLDRERHERLFQPDTLLSEFDCGMISSGNWPGPFDLPEDGVLVPKLSQLAYRMQEKGRGPEVAQVRISYPEASRIIDHARARDILKAGVSLNVVDIDTGKKESVAYFHQLLQEYFAARQLAKEPNPPLVHVEWAVDHVSPTLEEALKDLADSDPLPPQPQTGWEETTVTAAPMAENPDAFIRDLIEHNLPLAARCAASPEIQVDEKLKREIRDRLIARTRDMQCDLRARIAAGEALGIVGDPRLELREGPFGKYLLPPLVEIPGGKYPIGDRKSPYPDEQRAHKVDLETFHIGQFPVTNAEYKYFVDAGGYQDERWWDTEESRAWLRGEASTEGNKQWWRNERDIYLGKSDEEAWELGRQYNLTSVAIKFRIEIRDMTDEEFEENLDEWFPSGKQYREPEFWDDARFNNPAQPVVGVTWFEARAYCNWLTAIEGGERIFRLPTEVEYEAAARGKKGRNFPYGDSFDPERCNTFESHIRRSTPVGIFDNATPEGVFDLSGNVWTWTISIYDENRFPYPYRQDERENVSEAGANRVLRGGSWSLVHGFARAVYRNLDFPGRRDVSFGFRVVLVGGPPSQKP